MLLPTWLLLGQNPNDMRPPYGQERGLEKSLPVRTQHADLGQGNEILAEIELILNALVPTHVKMPAYQVCSRLDRGWNGNLRHNISKDFAFFVIFKSHGFLFECGHASGNVVAIVVLV